MGLREYFGKAKKMGAVALTGLSALVSGVACPPTTLPYGLPAYNWIQGPTAGLYEGSLQKKEEEGNPETWTFTRLDGAPSLYAGTAALVLPNAPRLPPFDVNLIPTKDVHGLWEDYNLVFTDNKNDDFVNGETFTVLLEHANNALLSVPYAVSVTYDRGLHPSDIGSGMPGPQGSAGQDGQDGQDGNDGNDGLPGISCWDLNENRMCDLMSEDRNGDGLCDVLDCNVTPQEIFDTAYTSINNTVRGTGDANIYLGDNVVHYFHPRDLIPLVGNPNRDVIFSELGGGVTQPGCYRIDSASVTQLERDPALDTSEFEVWTSYFTMVSDNPCLETTDLIQASVDLNGFEPHVNDSELAFNSPAP